VPSWHCQCNNGHRKASPPHTSHLHLQQTPLTCWRHTTLPWTTLRLRWGCISSRKGQDGGLHKTHSRTQCFIPGYKSVFWGQEDHPSGLNRNTANFGTKFPHYRPPRSNQGLFLSRNKRRGLPLWYQIILGFKKYIWWGLIFHLFGTPFADFL